MKVNERMKTLACLLRMGGASACILCVCQIFPSSESTILLVCGLALGPYYMYLCFVYPPLSERNCYICAEASLSFHRQWEVAN